MCWLADSLLCRGTHAAELSKSIGVHEPRSRVIVGTANLGLIPYLLGVQVTLERTKE